MLKLGEYLVGSVDRLSSGYLEVEKYSFYNMHFILYAKYAVFLIYL